MLRTLFDTNSLLWLVCDPRRLTREAKRAVVHSEEVWFSVVNLWEIAIKLSKGGFRDLDVDPNWHQKLVPSLLRDGYRQLSVEVSHCRRVQDLPFHHKDPFDRMLIAQALVEGLDVIGSDWQFDAYGVRRVW